MFVHKYYAFTSIWYKCMYQIDTYTAIYMRFRFLTFAFRLPPSFFIRFLKSKFRHLLFFSFSKIDICLNGNRRRKGASQKGRFNRLRAFSEDVLSSRKDAEIQLRLKERANIKEILDLKRSLKHDSVLPVRLRF